MPKELLCERKENVKLAAMTFNVMSPEEIKRMSSVKVFNRELYVEKDHTKPMSGGLLDPRLGNVSKDTTAVCTACKQTSPVCMGHYGHVDLVTDVVHVGFEAHLLRILQSICKACGRVLLSKEQRQRLARFAYQSDLQYTLKKQCWRKVLEAAKKCHVCYYCGHVNGAVKKGNLCYFLYDKLRFIKKSTIDVDEEEDPALAKLAKKGVMQLSPDYVHRLLELIPETDLPFLFMGESQPQDLLWSRILVPPTNIRPVVYSQQRKGTNQDDLTCCLQNVLTDIDKLYVSYGNTFEELTANLGVYINSGNTRAKKMLPDPSSVPRRCLTQRIKGKQGRFRGNLSGKRTNFTMRSVISPDPNCAIDEVVIPLHVARTLTFPEYVTHINERKMRELVLRGPFLYPGAKEVIKRKGEDNEARFELTRKEVCERQAEQLRPGDVVERHIVDGDIVLFNRQPSLHRVSIMAFKAVIRPGLTLRFNECVCAPFNADFDGDEMNIHFPQTLEARAECMVLLHSAQNICSPKSGDPLIGATQDFITGAYLMTHKDTFLTHREVLTIVGALCSKEHTFDSFELPPPAILKPRRLWTGKQVFNVVLNPNRRTGLLINVRCASKLIYTDRDQEFCANDGFVYIRRGELLAGTMDKRSLGNGCKQGVYYIVYRDYGAQAHALALWRLCRATAMFIMEHGFTIGCVDVVPTPQMAQLKVDKLREGFLEFYSSYSSYYKGELRPQPGCDTKTSFENLSNKQLSSIRDALGKCALQTMSTSNPVVIMATCGSKGSVSNLSQMAGCVGQQIVNGQRIMEGFGSRTTPHFSPGALFPEAKGFCKNSFYTGLSPHEYVFHTVSGREGLVDTAVKTAQTGYMQRRIIKGLEDCVVDWDGTVRTHRKEVVQFKYGSDSIDPTFMETPDLPIDLDRAWLNSITNHQYSHEVALTAEDFQQYIDNIQLFIHANDFYCESIVLKLRQVSGHDLQRDRVTHSHVIHFLTTCQERFQSALIEPCSPVGGIACQSVGEPATQMTLKTFHFAGVASMNITQGVPRMQELIDGNEAKTAMISAQLMECGSVKAAYAVRARAMRTELQEVCASIGSRIEPMSAFVVARVDWERVAALHLSLTLQDIVEAVRSAKIRHIKLERVYAKPPDEVCMVCVDLNQGLQLAEAARHIVVSGSSELRKAVIQSSDASYITVTPHTHYVQEGFLSIAQLLDALQLLPFQDLRRIQAIQTDGVRLVFKKKLSEDVLQEYARVIELTVAKLCQEKIALHVVSGAGDTMQGGVAEEQMPITIHNVVSVTAEPEAKHYEVFFEGRDLKKVLSTVGVCAEFTHSNNIPEIHQTLGIEAARCALMRELTSVMQNHGVEVNPRHVMLLIDRMTCCGRIDGFQRNSIAKMKESALALASFELALNHLYEAAFHGQTDELTGVSESVIVGNLMPLGTGMFDLIESMGDLRFTPRPTIL